MRESILFFAASGSEPSRPGSLPLAAKRKKLFRLDTPSPSWRGGRGVRSLLLLALLLLATPAFAQQQPKPQQLPANDDSTVLFRGLLHFHKIQPEAATNLRPNYDYSNLIVVVYGDPQSQDVRNYCRRTLSGGGAVLIAADTQMSVSGYFPEPGNVKIVGGRVSFDKGALVDSGLPNRPIVFPMPNVAAGPFSGIERLATNDPSYLLSPNPPPSIPLKPVAAFPPGANVTTPTGLPDRGAGILPLAFAVASDDRQSVRCMVLADPDVFSNRMIYTSGREQNPTDNLRFANNTVQWLQGNGRTKCLFIEHGNVVSKFDDFEFSSIPIGPQLPPPPVPNIDPFNPELQQKLANALNEAADQAQKNDVMNQGILAPFHGKKWFPVAILSVLLLIFTYILFRWRTASNWYRRVFRPIPRDPAMLGPDVPVGSLEHRRLELLRSTDYGPVVRPVVLQLFQDRGLPGEYTGDKLPPLDIDVRRPQFLKDAIHSLWAVVRSPAPLGYGKWKQLEPLLAAVRAAADDDRWRFVAPSPRDAAS